MSNPDPPAEPLRSGPWVEAWRDGIRTSSSAAGLLDLASGRFIELSDRGAALLGTTPAEGRGLEYLRVAQWPLEAARTFEMARRGLVDGVTARRSFRLPGGEAVEIRSHGQTVRWPNEIDLGLWAVPEGRTSADPQFFDELQAPPTLSRTDPGSFGIEIAHERWTATDATLTLTTLLGYHADELDGTPIVELIHRHDVAAVWLALARATTDDSATVRARLRRQDGRWLTVSATIAATRIAAPRFEMMLSSVPVDVDGNLSRASVHGLPTRQAEVVTRLLRGERVATIAAEMYLSPSTVRNHLTAVFRRFDVHSQEELLRALRPSPGTTNPIERDLPAME